MTDLEPDRRFVWRAPFSEWSRAFLGTSIEVWSDGDRRTEVTETLFVEAAEEHLPVVRAFLAQPGLDGATFERFLGARLAGLARLLDAGELSVEERSFLFTTDRQVAADWPGRIAEGEWVRVLYADGELDFDAPAELVFNAFARFARYPDWTRAIHVAAEWLDIRAGRVGSRFLLWEKPRRPPGAPPSGGDGARAESSLHLAGALQRVGQGLHRHLERVADGRAGSRPRR